MFIGKGYLNCSSALKIYVKCVANWLIFPLKLSLIEYDFQISKTLAANNIVVYMTFPYLCRPYLQITDKIIDMYKLMGVH